MRCSQSRANCLRRTRRLRGPSPRREAKTDPGEGRPKRRRVAQGPGVGAVTLSTSTNHSRGPPPTRRPASPSPTGRRVPAASGRGEDAPSLTRMLLALRSWWWKPRSCSRRSSRPSFQSTSGSSPRSRTNSRRRVPATAAEMKYASRSIPHRRTSTAATGVGTGRSRTSISLARTQARQARDVRTRLAQRFSPSGGSKHLTTHPVGLVPTCWRAPASPAADTRGSVISAGTLAVVARRVDFSTSTSGSMKSCSGSVRRSPSSPPANSARRAKRLGPARPTTNCRLVSTARRERRRQNRSRRRRLRRDTRRASARSSAVNFPGRSR
jgi:hypothetical protein